MGALWIGFFDEAVADLACEHFLIVFFSFFPDGRDFTVLHALKDNFNGHIVPLERNFGLNRMLKC